MMSSAANSKNDYHVGIITALPIERAAIEAMLDAIDDKPYDFDQSTHDPNSYTWGRLGRHLVVIASLASGVYGNTMATTTAMPMLYSFTNIKFGLMVGIGAGIPISHDVRLGDVVVSQPSGNSGGVFQYDIGKAKRNEWERKDFLARPPDILLKALNKLQTEHEFRIPQAHEHLRTAIMKHEYWGQSYNRPSTDDYLFPSSYPHHMDSLGNTCSACDLTKAVKRTQRSPLMEFKIHYGVIASGNSLVKDTELRDQIASMDKQCICIEMEAAGLMNNFPCLVIRGICDYADSHKNDTYQRYACATAAALTKEFLSFVPLTDSKTATKAAEVLQVPNSEPLVLPLHARNGYQQAEHNRSLSQLPSDDSIRSELPISVTSTRNSTSPDMSPNKTSAPASSADKSETTKTPLSPRYPILKGGKVNARSGENNDTLLHSAAREGNVEVAAWLIESGADIEAKNKEDATPLLIAAQENHLDVVRILINNDANIETTHETGYPILYVAARNGHLDIVEFLIEHKANININATTNARWTALHGAAKNGHAHVVKLLIKNNADIEAITAGGDTALYIAAQNGHLDVVKLLIENKANIESTGQSGYTVLHIAARNGHLDVVKLLIENKVNIGAKDKEGWTVLHSFAWKGRLDAVKFLINHKANIDAADNYGCTALYIAAQTGHLDMVKFLIERKANIKAAHMLGYTSLYIAARNGHLNVVKLMVEHRANINGNVNATAETGWTALHGAVENGHLDVVIFLLKNGASIHVKSSRGSVLDAAKRSRRTEMVEVLRTHGLTSQFSGNYNVHYTRHAPL